MKNLFTAFLVGGLLVVAGCFPSGDSGADADDTPLVSGENDAVDASDIKNIDISSLGSTVTVIESSLFNLTVSGLNNTVMVASGNKINEFSLSGLNNLITIEDGVTISSFTASGSDNTVIVPDGSGITFTDTGLNNTLIEQ